MSHLKFKGKKTAHTHTSGKKNTMPEIEDALYILIKPQILVLKNYTFDTGLVA